VKKIFAKLHNYEKLQYFLLLFFSQNTIFFCFSYLSIDFQLLKKLLCFDTFNFHLLNFQILFKNFSFYWFQLPISSVFSIKGEN